MFHTFRHRLLFWFLIFISFSFIIVFLSILYIQKREVIFNKTNIVEKSYIKLLKSVKAQQDFFTYETKNQIFFQLGESIYQDRYASYRDSTITLLDSVNFKEEQELNRTAIELKAQVLEIDSLFTVITSQVEIRGYKDYNLEGAMRSDVHWLENARELPKDAVLSLRRHEKDFIIRNDDSYVRKLTKKVKEIEDYTKRSNWITRANKDSIFHYLRGYYTNFKKLVALDKRIGIKDNTGLKLALDEKIEQAESSLNTLVSNTELWSKNEFNNLTHYFLGLGIFLLLFSLILSTLIANKITKPLTNLTENITRFVDSNFTLESNQPIARSKDEIGKLAKNFSHLRDEVISTMKFFKQKVDERTAELATANDRLIKLSEANSRFVPDEFLNNLNRKSIEEVKLGDHVECEMTIMFTDIREFTQLSEALTPEENFDFLNTYLQGIVPIIQKYHGFIDKFIGDSVMALFPRNPLDAIRAVMEFEDFLVRFNEKRFEEGKPIIRIGTGIHTGELILGTIGHNNRLETTVISDAVNTAARVEGLTKYYNAKVIGTEAMLTQLNEKDTLKYRFLDKVNVKGKSKSLGVYEFLSEYDTEKLLYVDTFNKAVKLIEKRDIKAAMRILQKLNKEYPEDRVLKIFLERCKEYIDTNATDWTDTTKMATK